MNSKCIKLLTILFSFCIVISLTACEDVKKKAPAKKVESTENIVDDKKREEEEVATQDIKEVQEDTAIDNSKEKLEDNIKGSAENIVEINEKIFLQKINDIYFNFDDYKDSTIVIEGMFSYFENMDGTETRPVVYRNGPGCCGNDGWGGFFLIYEEEYPQENDWIRVVGRPVLVEAEGGWLELFLEVESVEVKEERGLEFVSH